jgi:hypothetical protein
MAPDCLEVWILAPISTSDEAVEEAFDICRKCERFRGSPDPGMGMLGASDS